MKKSWNVNITVLQPWTVPIFQMKLPDDILSAMIRITDKIVDDKESKSHGEYLAGQVDRELIIDKGLLKDDIIDQFIGNAVLELVKQCYRNTARDILIPKLQVMLQSFWIVSQMPNEYNPIHFHTDCQVSGVMYLKVPKMLPQRKEKKRSINGLPVNDDGALQFVGQAGRDLSLCVPNILAQPKVGDLYIFGSQQLHAVYPFRCEEGDPERRNVSFNAAFRDTIPEETETTSEEYEKRKTERVGISDTEA